MADISIPHKRCTKCKQEFPATNEFFHKNSSVRDGLRPDCKSCVREFQRNSEQKRMLDPEYRAQENKRIREYYRIPEVKEVRQQKERERCANDPEYLANKRSQKTARMRVRRVTDPVFKEKADKQVKKRRQNPEAVARDREKHREWMHSEQGKLSSKASRDTRRARKQGAEGTHTLADVKLQYKSQKGKCWHCGKPLNNEFHVDHLVPLSRGGSNYPNNIVCSCAKCNLAKHNKLNHEWNGKLF